MFPRIALVCSLLLTFPASAQQPSSLDRRWPGEQLQQQQQAEQAPSPARPERSRTARPAETQEAEPTPPPKVRPQPMPARVVACSGIFAKDSSHLKLATFVGADNIAWTQVDGPEGSKLDATVLYPRDPKRRLEVLWNLEASRSDTQLIVINGRSTWIAPKGLKLGMPLASLEKLNGKPFVMKAFAGENGGSVTSWENGALSTLPGGCKVGIRLAPGPKAPAPSGELASEKEVGSNLPALRALAPKVAEIIIGY
ncbi:MAG TPA: hypothetical protein VNR11_05405 [Xanthobacteraceae bacterium]|nr:hypothetical protein [Xanthobacteraceae bacterium]